MRSFNLNENSSILGEGSACAPPPAVQQYLMLMLFVLYYSRTVFYMNEVKVTRKL